MGMMAAFQRGWSGPTPAPPGDTESRLQGSPGTRPAEGLLVFPRWAGHLGAGFFASDSQDADDRTSLPTGFRFSAPPEGGS